MERISAHVDKKREQDLEAEARLRGQSASDIASRAHEDRKTSPIPSPSCLDIARLIGIIGIYKDTPADLSTNPKHMEGFGGA